MLRNEGRSVGTVCNYMTLINAALNMATGEDEDDGDALLVRAPKLIYSIRDVAATLNEAEPAPRNWHPDLDMIAVFLNGLLPKEEPPALRHHQARLRVSLGSGDGSRLLLS